MDEQDGCIFIMLVKWPLLTKCSLSLSFFFFFFINRKIMASTHIYLSEQLQVSMGEND